MYTTKVRTEEYGDVLIHHNGDWSGIVHICYDFQDNGKPFGESHKEVLLPGEVAVAVFKAAAVEMVLSKVQDALDLTGSDLPTPTSEREVEDV